MSTSQADLVIVGVDRSPEAFAVASYALQQAQTWRCGLLLVHTYDPPNQSEYYNFGVGVELHTDGVALLDELAGLLADQPGPSVEVSNVVRQGSASLTLAALSPGARCIVVGRRKAGWGERLLTGSVSSRLSAIADCPVVTVPHGYKPAPTPPGPIVVALDGRSGAHTSLAYAFNSARQHLTDLVVLHAAPTDATQQDLRQHDLDLAQTLAGWRSQYPDVAVTTSTVQESPSAACEDASRDASLLVLGRSTGPHLLSWSRSVARSVLRNAHCPLATVPLHPSTKAPSQQRLPPTPSSSPPTSCDMYPEGTEHMPRPTIVVGLNHTEAGGGALSYALERAAAVHHGRPRPSGGNDDHCDMLIRDGSAAPTDDRLRRLHER